jgi:phosphoesterase RecJ-like protein
MQNISEVLTGVTRVGISGHVRPDGDCVGSCLAVYNYIKKNFPEIQVDVRLDPISEKYKFIAGSENIKTDANDQVIYDLYFALDSSNLERLGNNIKYFEAAKRRVCIDHHVSNERFADVNHVVSDASSACEVIFDLMDEDKLNKDIAEALYTGIVTDSGVFKYESTSGHTMSIAGKLMDYGLDVQEIIDGTFYRKSYKQNQILGRILLESMLVMDGKCIVAYCTGKLMKFYGVTPDDLDGVVEQLRLTDGVECAVFLYELSELNYKISLRSKKYIDVSKVAIHFGGGGHIRAAGFNMNGTVHDIINNITQQLEIQFNEFESK